MVAYLRALQLSQSVSLDQLPLPLREAGPREALTMTGKARRFSSGGKLLLGALAIGGSGAALTRRWSSSFTRARRSSPI